MSSRDKYLKLDSTGHICFHSIMGIVWSLLKSKIIWFLILSIFVLGALFYLVLGRGVESSVEKQLLRRQKTIARAEASNIIFYFQTFGNSVAVLAQQRSIELRNANAVLDLDTFVGQRKNGGRVGGVVLTDENGIVKFNSNILGTRDTGDSVADREYFIWAKEAQEGEYFISEPVISRLGASEGETIIVVASPVIADGLFTGVIAASVRLKPLSEQFLGLMKISEDTEIYLTDGQGKLLYSNFVPDVGSDISGIFSGEPVLKEGIENIIGETEERQFRAGNKLVAYKPIKVGDQNWLLIIASPMQEIKSLTAPFYVRLTAILILTSFTILLFGVIAIRKNQV